MNLLAIETSCDETAMAVLNADNKKIRVISNVISSQIKIHAKFGGVVPNLAAREHTKNIGHVFDITLKDAGINDFKNDIDLIAVTRGPGLGPALLVGITYAKTLAWKYKKKIIGVNHLEGHIYSNWLSSDTRTQFPALNLIVSGGHTELVLMKNHGQYQVVGETLDDAVGEAFDKVARLLDLGYPGGPIVSKMAENGDPNKYDLPRPMAKSKDFNFSYSGLKTAVLYLLKDLKEEKTKFSKEDICASFQNAAIDVLILKTEAAGRKNGVKSLLLSGGVSANMLLREKLSHVAVENGWIYSQPEMRYTTDNAAMIGVAGYFNSLKKTKSQLSWWSVQMDANLGF